MTALVLPRLYLGGAPLVRALGIVSTTFGIALLAFLARAVIRPLGPGADTTAMISGSVAFLLSGAVAALAASAVWDLRSSTFAWITPHLARRLRREVTILGLVLFVAAAGIGATMHGVSAGDGFFLAIAAALGYVVGLVATTPIVSRFGGVVGVLLAMVPLVCTPEAVQFMRHADATWGFLWLVFSAGILVVVTERFGAKLERRYDAPVRRGEIGSDPRRFATTNGIRRTPRDGADRFAGLRQSDLDWVRALLHETYGFARGGLLGSALRLGLTTVIVTFLVRLFFRVFAGTASTPEAGHAERAPEGLSNFSLDWFTTSFVSRQEELIATNLIAIILGTVLWSSQSAPASFSLPLSRRRLAWIAWLKTQAEEVAALGGILTGFLATAVLVAWISASDPTSDTEGSHWSNLTRFCAMSTAIFALLPVTRWMRLRWMDGRAPSGPRDPDSEAHDPRTVTVYAVSMSVVIGGATILDGMWRASSALLRAELPDALHVWIPLIAIVLIVALRWLWLVELRRFYRRSDLR